ncbi:MAG TPA: cell division protein FtsL [Verrucomicrobiae bacterium]|jgi:cell division protein FtsL|nr:cell division protein FtsL [Verrucomicrobiae bacterium]
MALALGNKRTWSLNLFKGRQAESIRVAAGGGFLLPALLGLGLLAMALAHVWLRLQVVHMGYALSTATKLERELEQENRELKVELATLTSPRRLEAMARARLGMSQPQRGQVVILP